MESSLRTSRTLRQLKKSAESKLAQQKNLYDDGGEANVSGDARANATDDFAFPILKKAAILGNLYDDGDIANNQQLKPVSTTVASNPYDEGEIVTRAAPQVKNPYDDDEPNTTQASSTSSSVPIVVSPESSELIVPREVKSTASRRHVADIRSAIDLGGVPAEAKAGEDNATDDTPGRDASHLRVSASPQQKMSSSFDNYIDMTKFVDKSALCMFD